jgi:hypothetical protein
VNQNSSARRELLQLRRPPKPAALHSSARREMLRLRRPLKIFGSDGRQLRRGRCLLYP